MFLAVRSVYLYSVYSYLSLACNTLIEFTLVASCYYAFTYLQLKILNKAKTDFLTAQDINNNMEADDNVNNTTLSRKRFVTRLSVSAKVVKHSEDDTINIIPVKLCYKKNRSPIGSGRFGTVTAGKILSVCAKNNGNSIQLKSEDVAVKTIVLRPASFKELNILQKLSHDHIVQLLAHHKNDRELHLIFERLNFTLYEKLDHDGPFDIDDCLGLSIQLFKALDYLESELIIHRDIKPTNILLNESCRSLKLCDFGCAREITNFEDKYASYMCSRFYRSPELLLGIEVYDFKVDIWSAACVIAEMLCAR